MEAIRPLWVYENSIVTGIEDMPEDTYGFIYEVVHKPTGKRYIGKKVLYFTRNVKLGKKELEQAKAQRAEKGLRGRVPAKKVVIKESDWKTYFGSQEEVKTLLKESSVEDFSRTILQYVTSKKLLTYYETKWLFLKEVLENRNNYLNDNILGKFYRKDFDIK